MRCPLYRNATQVVPGDREDLAGRPFVGPAGKLFDAALDTAFIPRDALFVTNAVKHFKFTPRGATASTSRDGSNPPRKVTSSPGPGAASSKA